MLRLLRSIRAFFTRLFPHKVTEVEVLEYRPPYPIGGKTYSPEPSVTFKEYDGKYGSMRTGRLTALSSQFTMFKHFIEPHRPAGESPYCEPVQYGRRCST